MIVSIKGKAMPLIEKDKYDASIILDLSEDEKKAWRNEYGKIRKREQLSPSEYIDLAVEKLGGYRELRKTSEQTTKLIFSIREAAWEVYTQHEQMVYGLAMKDLLRNNEDTRNVLRDILDRDGAEKFQNISREDLVDLLASITGEISGRIFPYPYELAKSITQSRRSRAGTAFERIIRHVINIFEFPCDDQSKIARTHFTQGNLGKMVDGLIPGIKEYEDHRSKCAILTMKTTLRERWQEVVEELQRTNVPHVYLLTLDENITDGVLETVRNHNITLVAPDYVKERTPDRRNLISFEELFNRELPHIVEYWKNR